MTEKGQVTMKVQNALDLIFEGTLSEEDCTFFCPTCDSELEWSGMRYWYCYHCDKKVFKEDFE